MSDEPQRWDIQGFHDGEAGRAGWSVGVTGNAEAIVYLNYALIESDSAVFLIRRGPQLGLYDAPGVEPYRLVAADARDRLARHLYLETVDPPHLRESRARLWDERPEYVDKEWAYRKADAVLAAIAPPDLTPETPDPTEAPE